MTRRYDARPRPLLRGNHMQANRLLCAAEQQVSFLNKNTERIAAVIEAKQRDLRTIETVLQARRNEASAP